MTASRSCSLIFCLSLLAACASTSPATSTDAGVVRGTAAIGAPCAKDTDCAVGICLTGMPGGYCGETCTNSTACPANTFCVQASLTQFSCLKGCTADSDCRGGYVCAFTNHVCVPGCSRDEDCLGQDSTCVSGQCHTNCVLRCQCPSGQACNGCPTGQVCTSPSQSPNGYCDAPMDADAGLSCATDCDCPTGQGCTNSACAAQ